MYLARFCPRFTIRRLMAAVAIVALLMGAGIWIVEMRARSVVYRRKAFEFGDIVIGGVGKSMPMKDGRRWVNAYDYEDTWRRRAWACKLAEKYWRLADRPWLQVEPDPPPPAPLAHPRWAVDLPADYPEWHWYREPVFPRWTFLWTWQTWPNQRYGGGSARQGAWRIPPYDP